ncbi:GlsB/YeaQ/YmgE family stress response membrane protein [Rhodococcus sp. BP22]|uniref:GlsB/YeaQ/YmgE family stress response membrane protein n=1 Tax=Rhodococcus sp. BP22 TaxID=2758566 RepID=UPI001645045C|nr:GlsB/YeaQ/YmgE family stress response membrane protein [Rhodococcus sp. BP22]
MLIIGIILFGLLIGAGAQLILGRSKTGMDWTLAFTAGIVGSFVGGLVVSLIAGDGISLRPSGIIGSLLGALLVTALWQRFSPARSNSQ